MDSQKNIDRLNNLMLYLARRTSNVLYFNVGTETLIF